MATKKTSQDWSLLKIVKAMETNMQFQMTYFAKYVDTMKLLVQQDVTVVQSSLGDDTFNYILSARFSDNNVQNRVLQMVTLQASKE